MSGRDTLKIDLQDSAIEKHRCSSRVQYPAKPESSRPVWLGRFWLQIVVWLIVFGVGPSALLAQPGTQPASKPVRNSMLDRIYRVDVPADHPSQWPKDVQRTTVVDRAEFEKLLSAARGEEHQGPRSASIKSAHFTATLAGSSLLEGRAVLGVHRVVTHPVLVSLGQFDVPISDLQWKDRSAVWGSDSDGHAWLMADVASGELTASWSAAGRRLADRIDFDLTWPVATVTTLDVKVPKDRIVRSIPEAIPVPEGSDDNGQVWRMQLGSERRSRFQIVPKTTPATVVKPTVVYESEMSALVRSENLRFQTLLQLEIFDAPITDLTLSVPASIEVYAVSYGSDIPLTWSRPAETDEAGILTIKLPEPLIGRSRPIRIDGLVTQKLPGQQTISPQISVVGGVFSAGRQILTIVAPLQLRSFRSSGYRQSAAATPTPDGETVMFKQLLPDAQLVLDVRQPPASLSAQVTSLFEARTDSWMLSSEIAWSSSSGDVYQTRCQLPPDWEVTDVQLVTSTSNFPGVQSTQQLAGWDVQTRQGEPTVISMEFLEAIVPNRPHAVRVFARRRPPLTGQPFALPLPHPSQCVSVESTLGLVVPSGMTPQLSADAKLERISPLEDAAVQALRRSNDTPTQKEFWYRGDTPDAVGSLQLVPRLRPVTATIDVIVEAAPAEYRERFEIRSRNEGRPLDKLLVYLTQPGPEVRWTMLLPRPDELTAIRLPVSQHSDWNCPHTGELWELRLPPLPDGPIELIGTRSRRWEGAAQPALLFVPQAADRRGRLKLRRPASLELSVEPNSLEPQAVTGADAAADGGSGGDDTIPFDVNQWQYDAFSDELTVSLKRPEPSRDFPTMVSLQLSSLISTNSDGFDLYRARIRLENGTVQDQLRMSLPSPAVVQEVLVAGEATVPETIGELIVINSVNAARHDLVELLYRVPAKGRPVRDVRRIIVPQIQATVLSFDWEFALPPTVRLFSEPTGIRLSRLPSRSIWTERLFGPLGRSADESLFNPINASHWQQLLQPPKNAHITLGELSSEMIAPVEWQVHRASSPVVPQELWLVTWHSARTRLVSWIVLALTLSVGIGLRMIGWRHRDRLGIYWLTLLISLAACCPSPLDEIAGGAIAGTIITLLMPRSMLRVPRSTKISIPTGSTQNFRMKPVLRLLLVMLGLAATVLAQDADRTIVGPTREEPLPQDSGSSREAWTVYVPVDRSGRPSEKLPMVYVAPELLARLKDLASVRQGLAGEDASVPKASTKAQPTAGPERRDVEGVSPKTLTESARYRATISATGTVSLRANFRVHVLDGSVEQSLVLPIPDAVPTGPEACRINGKPHPILSTPDGRGLLVTLPPVPSSDLSNSGSTPNKAPGSASDITEGPADATQPDNSGQRTKPELSPADRAFDIELDLKRIGNRTTSGGGFTLSVPKVVDSRWSVSIPEATEFLEVLGSRGMSTSAADRRGIESVVGVGDRVDVQWQQTVTKPKPVSCEISLLHVLNLRPDSSEVQFRMTCEPINGGIDSLDLEIPTGALVRPGDVRCTNVLDVDITSIPSTMSEPMNRLRLTFSKTRHDSFTVDGRFLIPFDKSGAGIGLPGVSAVRSELVRPSLIRHWWWIAASSEFKLDSRNVEGDLTASVGPAEFLAEWGDAPPTGVPHLVFQPREGSQPSFELAPQVTRRRAIQWNQSGRVGKRRLDWTLNASIETTNAPVFQHVLLVDRRLQIESVSVRENGAERLVRWSETRQIQSPTRVTLFLTDKTQGIQQVLLKGSLPLRYGSEIPLPMVRCEEAEQGETQWELFRDPEVDVDLILPRGVPQLMTSTLLPDALATSSPTIDGVTSDTPPVLIARYSVADPDPKTKMRVSSRHAPCAARSIGLIARTDDRGWKLTGQIWLTPQGESPRRLGIRFPENVDPDRIRIQPSEVSGAWHDPEDGFRRVDVTLPPHEQQPPEVSVTFDIIIDEPSRGDWELPWPVPMQASQHEIALLASPPDVWTPLIGTELKPDEAPGWADEFLSERMPDSASALYRLSQLPVKLRHTVVASHLDRPVVRLLDHSLWLSADQQVHGVTRAYLSQTRDGIDFQIPSSSRLIALFLDDHPLPLPSQKLIGANAGNQTLVTRDDDQSTDDAGASENSTRTLRIPLIGGGRESILVLVWEHSNPTEFARDKLRTGQPSTSSMKQPDVDTVNFGASIPIVSETVSRWMPRSLREAVPWPERIDVARSLVTVLPHRLGWVVGSSLQTSRDWLDAAFDRLEMLLDRQQSLDNDPRAAASNQALIDEMQLRVSARIPALAARPSKGLASRLERWNRIVSAIDDLAPADRSQTHTVAIRSLAQLDELFVDHPHAMRTIAAADRRDISFWLFDRTGLSVVLAVLLTLLALPGLRRLIRLDWGEWLSARSSISWMLLGFVWWLLLTPGFLGPVMIVAATARAAWVGLIPTPLKRASTSNVDEL